MIDYPHEQHIHCENGAIRNIFKFNGVYISEPLIFGIGSGMTFKHLPFIKVESFGLTIARPEPVKIFKNLSDALGFKLYKEKFIFKQRSMQRLDELLAQGIPVGLVVNQYHLPSFLSSGTSCQFQRTSHSSVWEGGKPLLYKRYLE